MIVKKYLDNFHKVHQVYLVFLSYGKYGLAIPSRPSVKPERFADYYYLHTDMNLKHMAYPCARLSKRKILNFVHKNTEEKIFKIPQKFEKRVLYN